MSDFKNQRELIAWLAEGNKVYWKDNKEKIRSMDSDGDFVYEDVDKIGYMESYQQYSKIIHPRMIKIYRPKWAILGVHHLYSDLPIWAKSKEEWERIVDYHKKSDEWEEKEVPAEVFE